MDTHNEKPKPTQRIPTEIEYREPGQWKIGQTVLTVMGGLPDEEKRPIGYVELEGYGEDKKPILIAKDLEGNELCERSGNLYAIKKEFLRLEQMLTKDMLIRNAQEENIQETSVQEPEVQPPITRTPRTGSKAHTR